MTFWRFLTGHFLWARICTVLKLFCIEDTVFVYDVLGGGSKHNFKMTLFKPPYKPLVVLFNVACTHIQTPHPPCVRPCWHVDIFMHPVLHRYSQRWTSLGKVYLCTEIEQAAIELKHNAYARLVIHKAKPYRPHRVHSEDVRSLTARTRSLATNKCDSVDCSRSFSPWSSLNTTARSPTINPPYLAKRQILSLAGQPLPGCDFLSDAPFSKGMARQTTLLLLSRVPHGTCILTKMSQKF